MSKIGLIVSREFNQRVRKKSFILTTILTPLLLVGLMVAPALVMQLRSDQVKRIAVVDRSGIVGDKLQGDRETVFVPADRSEERLREDKDEFYGYLVIGPDVLARSPPASSIRKACSVTSVLTLCMICGKSSIA